MAPKCKINHPDGAGSAIVEVFGRGRVPVGKVRPTVYRRRLIEHGTVTDAQTCRQVHIFGRYTGPLAAEPIVRLVSVLVVQEVKVTEGRQASLVLCGKSCGVLQDDGL